MYIYQTYESSCPQEAYHCKLHVNSHEENLSFSARHPAAIDDSIARAFRSSLQKSFLKCIFILLQILAFWDIFHTWSQTVLIESWRMICLGLSALPFLPNLRTISTAFCSCLTESGTTLDSILMTFSLVFSPYLSGTPFSRNDHLHLYVTCSKHDSHRVTFSFWSEVTRFFSLSTSSIIPFKANVFASTESLTLITALVFSFSCYWKALICHPGCQTCEWGIEWNWKEFYWRFLPWLFV